MPGPGLPLKGLAASALVYSSPGLPCETFNYPEIPARHVEKLWKE